MPKDKNDKAEKDIQNYCNKNGVGASRVAWLAHTITVSGGAAVPAITPALTAKWNAMLAAHKVAQATTLPLHNCAEAHMWMELQLQGIAPKNCDMWMYRIDNRNRIHRDAPCPNCQQWVLKDFRSQNGVKKAHNLRA